MRLAPPHAEAMHERVNGLHAADGVPGPAWRDWRVGYAGPDVLDSMLAAADRGCALQAFEQALRRTDLA